MSDTFVRSGSSPGEVIQDPPDVIVESHFSLFIIFPRSEAAKIWCDEHLPEDRMTWGDGGIVVESCYFWPILEALQDAQFVVVPR